MSSLIFSYLCSVGICSIQSDAVAFIYIQIAHTYLYIKYYINSSLLELNFLRKNKIKFINFAV